MFIVESLCEYCQNLLKNNIPCLVDITREEGNSIFLTCEHLEKLKNP